MPASSYFKSWLIFFLIASCGGAVAGGIIGAITGGAMGASGSPTERIRLVTGILGFVAALPVSFFTFQWSVKTWIVQPLLRQRAVPADAPTR